MADKHVSEILDNMSARNRLKVPFAYLGEQFEDAEEIFVELRELVARGDYTLGDPVVEFEEAFASTLGVRHALGVNSGTDAIKLSLEAAGIGPGDEVITTANTFIATVGAINELGARTVFVDCEDGLCMEVDQLEAAIGPRVKAIVPVHMSGNVSDMTRVLEIADMHALPVIEDACQAIMSTYQGKFAGTMGLAGAFSLHPQKFINIWGDGGVIVTNDDALADRLRLLRNHGLEGRDTIKLLGRNSRLDSVQAIVAKWVLARSETILRIRNEWATYYDAELAKIPQVSLPRRRPGVRHSFVTYQIFAENRDALLAHCIENGVECKVHYPIPLYTQEGLKGLGYKLGDFPVTDRQAETVITLPVHQYLKREQIEYTVEVIRGFYD